MNILQFSIRAIQKAGLLRSVGIVVVKVYRTAFESYRDRSVHAASAAAALKGFNTILPIDGTTASRFKSLFPAGFSSLLSNGQSIRQHHFELLGQTFQFNKKINWHFDPATKKEWQKKIYRETSLYYEGSPPDVKPVWELNRHQHFVTLAQAFYVSGDRVYFDELLAQWLDWIEDNPYRVGINWASPLELGVRLISWTMAFQFIEHHLSQKERAAIVRSVWEQLSFLSQHLSTDKIIRTNHLIGEAAGLFVAASSFVFANSDRWQATARKILEQEILSQVFDDGVAQEQSSSYHRFDVDLFLLAYLKAKSSPKPFSHHFEKRLHKMIRYLFLLETPGFELPAYGDNDDGRGLLVASSVNFWDARGLVAVGGRVFEDTELVRGYCFNEESFWLLSEAQWNLPRNDAGNGSERSTFFAESGHVVLGDRQSGDYCFFRAGEFGKGGDGYSSHSHNDLFSPFMYLNGVSILADTGTSVYLGNDEERDYLRSAAAHNATFASSWKFFEPQRWFGWKKRLNGKILKTTRSEDEIKIECGLAGYTSYRRAISFRPRSHSFTVEDSFTEDLAGIHSYFHLDHGLTVRVENNSVLIYKGSNAASRCTFSDNVGLSVEQGWISKSYGKKDASVVLHFTWDAIAHQPANFTFTTADTTFQ